MYKAVELVKKNTLLSILLLQGSISEPKVITLFSRQYEHNAWKFHHRQGEHRRNSLLASSLPARLGPLGPWRLIHGMSRYTISMHRYL